MGSKKHSNEHQPSILLSPEANNKIFSLLEPRTQALSTAVVGVVISKPPKHPEWRPLRTGVATLTKDFTRKSYYVQIYDIVDWERLREEELSKGTAYHASMPKFHQFDAGKGQTMGLKFSSEEEARRFAEIARTIVMTGLYKTDGSPPLPVAKSEKEQSDQNEEKCDGDAINSEDQPNPSSSTPPTSNNKSPLLSPPVNKSQHLAPPPPPPPVNRVASLAPTQSLANKSQRPLSSPPTTTLTSLTTSADENSLDKKRQKRITKEMIGKPTDFKHVYHVGFNSDAPIDEKALRAAVGSRPPTRPPPPPPPGKRNGNSQTPAGLDTKASTGAGKLKVSFALANDPQEIGTGVGSQSQENHKDSNHSPEHEKLASLDELGDTLVVSNSDSEATSMDSSFANELIEEYLKRSNITSDGIPQTDNISHEDSTKHNEIQTLPEEHNDTLLDQDMNSSEADKMSPEKEANSETQLLETSSTSLENDHEFSATEEPFNKPDNLDIPEDSSNNSSEHHEEPDEHQNVEETSHDLNDLNNANEDEEANASEDSRESPSHETSCSTAEQQGDTETVHLDPLNLPKGESSETFEHLGEATSADISSTKHEQERTAETAPPTQINNPGVHSDPDAPIAPVRHKKKPLKTSISPPPTPPTTPTEPEVCKN